MAAFEGLYLRRVGVLYAELDEWNARLTRINQLTNWPPHVSGGSFGRGSTFVTHWDRVTFNEVVRRNQKCVEFNCISEDGVVVNSSFLAPDEKTAGNLEAILRASKGEPLLSIGTKEIPES